jgi:hypothetical protein
MRRQSQVGQWHMSPAVLGLVLTAGAYEIGRENLEGNADGGGKSNELHDQEAQQCI